MQNEKNVTFQDIADYTHFSKTTISRFFNHPESVTEENRKKIADAMHALGYSRNNLARVLAKGNTEFIGLLIPNIYNGFYSMITELFLRTYEKYGYKFIVFTGSDDNDSERRYLNELLSYKVEGLVVLSHTIPSHELAAYNIPVVSIEREDKYISSVNTDNYMGGVQASGLLYKNDCDIFLLLNTPTNSDVPGFGRVQGFIDTCNEHALDYRILQYNMANDYESMAESVKQTLNTYVIDSYPGKRKGIFCLSDTCAIIVENNLIKKYGFLPDDYRIIGFDNTPASLESVLPITTIGQQADLIVDSAMQMLIAQIQHKNFDASAAPQKPIHKVIPPKLIIRDTTK